MTEHHALSPESLYHLLCRRDLTDPAQGVHPMQRLVEQVDGAGRSLGYPLRPLRLSPVRAARPGESPGPRLASSPEDILQQALDVAVPDGGGPVLYRAVGAVHGHDADGGLRLHGHQLVFCLLESADQAVGDPLPGLVTAAVRGVCAGYDYRLLSAGPTTLRRAFSVQLCIDGDWQSVGVCGRLAHRGRGEIPMLLLDLDQLLAQQQEIGGTEADTFSETG